MIDLHSHSTASDGSLNPKQLIQLAFDLGLSAIALTDHDTVDGLDEAKNMAQSAGIRFIPGIEIEAAWVSPGVFHILGLDIDFCHPAVHQLLENIQSARFQRNSLMIQKMNAYGLSVNLAEIGQFTAGEIIGRPHFADYLVSIGKVRSRQQAFDQFLTPGKPFFEPYPGIPLETIVATIHLLGGRVVVAHPLSLYVSWTRIGALMVEWAAIGVDAIETWHPSASWKDAQRLGILAEKAKLKMSAGSDFHGEHRPDRTLGRSLEERHKIDESFLSLFDN